jgi:hypothetical protein
LKKILSVILILSLLTAVVAYSKILTEEQQQEIIDRMLYLRGEGPRPASLDSLRRATCGMEIAADFHFNRQYFTGKYLSIAETLNRPDYLEFFYDTPGGHFRLHYDTTGPHAVYQVSIDTVHGGPDGIPDYVNKVADICDSVYAFEVGHLGYPAPVSDGTAGGGNGLIDIYIGNIGADYYGWTEPETYIDTLRYTSFIVIDNDYAGIPPYNQSTDMNRRLDAARVTLAHEFFHTIHYTMDWQEFEDQGTFVPQARYWWEMSATWMEEMMYDNINDYYTYLPYFYGEPFKSLQAVTSGIDLHQYGAMVFPLFLSERFDTVLIRGIWEKCRDYGPGPDFPQAANDAIYEFTGGTSSLHDAYQEFAVWNYFTGSRAAQAPSGYGFQEAANYNAMIPDSFFMTYTSYDKYDTFLTVWTTTTGWRDTLDNGDLNYFSGYPITLYEEHMPQNLGGAYIRMRNIDFVTDSVLKFGFRGGSNLTYNPVWDFSFIKIQSGVNPPDINMSNSNPAFDSVNTDTYSTVIVVATPVSTDYNAYYLKRSGFGYGILITGSFLNAPGGLVTFDPPYPNPTISPAADDYITFRALDSVAAPGQWAVLEVTIFNMAGEKVNFVTSDYNQYDSSEPLIARWYLDNQSGAKVAAGVYLAYYTFKPDDGTPAINGQFKIAIIK